MSLVLDRTARRILGVLVEKALTTPAYYPLTVNSLTAGCSQKNNRDPVQTYQEFEIEGSLRALFLEGWVTNVTQPGARVLKWKHRLDEKLALDLRETALLAELFLRGPVPPGELRAHVSRMCAVSTLNELETSFRALEVKKLVHVVRRTGERAPRYDHLLYPADEVSTPDSSVVPPAQDMTEREESTGEDLSMRVLLLEKTVNELLSRIALLEENSR